MQRLLMPFKHNRVFASYKTDAYKRAWGYDHYGIDIANKWDNGDGRIYASGEGVVLAVGLDDTLGYGLAIRYCNCYNHRTGKTIDVTIRYMHLENIYVDEGDKINANVCIGIEGNKGTTDAHLHIEADTEYLIE